jgi:hypothetical protein
MFRKNTSGLFLANDVTEANNDWNLEPHFADNIASEIAKIK